MVKNQDRQKQPAAAKLKPAGQTDPEVVLEVRRHWFGLFTLYGLMTFGLLMFLAFPMLVSDSQNDDLALVALGILGIAILLAAPLSFFIWKVYWGNFIRISRTEVRQLTRWALFHTKSSVLGLANIEDVTIIRSGFFAHFFNYGTLNIETAGEQENFTFRYCPKPEECMRKLMKMREEYLEKINRDQQSLR